MGGGMGRRLNGHWRASKWALILYVRLTLLLIFIRRLYILYWGYSTGYRRKMDGYDEERTTTTAGDSQ
jgi:hypothetical protein